ncbi:MAG TPA: RNase adapter RapZ, partial [Polyangiaceae bacterium]|nr:RNase adapter RapZ [Polyangiaceae bacterium]
MTTTNVVVVTGLSGAGKSTALAALEDLGFHSVENVPPSVIAAAVEACENAGVHEIALGFGGRVPGFLEGAADAVASLARVGERKVTVLFLDASDEAVLRRFSETRRPHPLHAEAKRRGSSEDLAHVAGGIVVERESLAPLRAMATVVIDTSSLRVHDLRKRVITLVRSDASTTARMTTRILSFGFKHGLPSDADLVLDVRFLDNPFFVPELRDQTGESRAVADYVLAAEDARTFIDKAVELLGFLVPRYEREGKSYLTIAI